MRTKLAFEKEYKQVFNMHNNIMRPLWDQYAFIDWKLGWNLCSDLIMSPFSHFDNGDWSIVRVNGKIDEWIFWRLLAHNQFPINQEVRSLSDFEYCYLPDAIHDRCHLPPLYSDKYSKLITNFGEMGSNKMTKRQFNNLSRLYWATIEFGLIMEDGVSKAFGAGIISSKDEIIKACENMNDTQISFDIDKIFKWEYDPYGIQDKHFIIEDMDQISEALLKI